MGIRELKVVIGSLLFFGDILIEQKNNAAGSDFLNSPIIIESD